MIIQFSHRVTRLFSRLGFRAVIVGATGIWLSMLSATAPAQSTRPYQMSILSSTDGNSNASVDIPIFTKGVFRDEAQPAGRSIAWLPPNANLNQYGLDWTRIVAVYVDEPYLAFLGGSNPSCYVNSGVDARADTLESMAAAVRTKAPSARFWVNFSQKEIDLIHDIGCPFNQPYIDVISMDIYHVAFVPTLSSRYSFLYANRATPYQQLALVAGTFTDPQQNELEAFLRLAGYFSFATNMNQRCDLPLGPTGVTRSYEGCPVWMIAGWTGGVASPGDAPNIRPLDHPNSTFVFNAWQAAFAAQRVDPSRARRAAAELISLWLTD